MVALYVKNEFCEFILKILIRTVYKFDKTTNCYDCHLNFKLIAPCIHNTRLQLLFAVSNTDRIKHIVFR